MPMTRQEIKDRIGTDSPELITLVLDCVRAAEADERERLRWDGVHTCGPTCSKPACVSMRAAVAAEREACAVLCENEKLQADDWIPDHYPGKHFAWAIRTRGDV